MSDSKPTTKRAVDAAAARQEKSTRPGPAERCPECDVLYRFCEGCHVWGCKCGDPVSVCQRCHQATCGNCGTPYGFVAASWVEDRLEERIRRLIASARGKICDMPESSDWRAGVEMLLADLERLSGPPEPEPEEVVGSVEQEVLETLCGGGTGGIDDDVIDAISTVARAVDELTKRTAAEWAALRSVIDEAAAEERQQRERIRLALGGGAR